MKMTKEMLNMLVEQIAHEMQNSFVYSNVESLLKFEGFDNMAKHFKHQVEEEFGHSRMIEDFLNDRNEMFTKPSVLTIDVEDYTMTQVAEFYLKREQDTTNKIELLLKQAEVDGDGLACKFLKDFIGIQREEEATAQSFFDKVTAFADNKPMLILFDNSFEV